MGGLNYQIQKGDVPAISAWLAKRITALPEEAFSDFQSCLATPTVSSLTKFIARWADEDLQERLYTTIRVARHRKLKSRKKNIMISQEAYSQLESLAKRGGFRSVTHYVDHYALWVWR